MGAPTMPWLRLYTDFVYNRKIIRLPEYLQLRLVKFWCLHRAGHFEGASLKDIAFELRLDETEVSESIEALKAARLIDKDGSIHHWKDHQPKEFTSTKRVQKLRAKRAGNVTSAADETHRVDKIRVDENRQDDAERAKPRSRPVDNSPPIGCFTLKDGSPFEITELMAAPWPKAYPHCDIRCELAKMDAWCAAHPERRKTRRGAMKFANGWMARAEESAKAAPPKPSVPADPGEEYWAKDRLRIQQEEAEKRAERAKREGV